MMPWEFEIKAPDDLLVFADLWEDYGASAQARACRWIHAMKRWPKKYKTAFRWRLWSHVFFTENDWELCERDTGFHDYTHNMTRYYATVHLAIMDVINHMVHANLPAPTPAARDGVTITFTTT